MLYISQRAIAAVSFCNLCVEFIAQSQIQGQVRSDSDIVLQIKAPGSPIEVSTALVIRSRGTAAMRAAGICARNALEKCSDIGKGHVSPNATTIPSMHRGVVINETSKLQAVPPLRIEQICAI